MASRADRNLNPGGQTWTKVAPEGRCACLVAGRRNRRGRARPARHVRDRWVSHTPLLSMRANGTGIRAHPNWNWCEPGYDVEFITRSDFEGCGRSRLGKLPASRLQAASSPSRP